MGETYALDVIITTMMFKYSNVALQVSVSMKYSYTLFEWKSDRSRKKLIIFKPGGVFTYCKTRLYDVRQYPKVSELPKPGARNSGEAELLHFVLRV